MHATPVPTDATLRALAESVGEMLRERGQVLATGESCTGGWIAKLLTDVAGSSGWFDGAAVTYGNDAKRSLLGVSAATLRRDGAVSQACALEMVAGALAGFGASIAVAVTGIAGPGGGTADKPVGTVWIAWGRRGGSASAQRFHFEGDRDAVRRRTVVAALQGVAKMLLTQG